MPSACAASASVALPRSWARWRWVTRSRTAVRLDASGWWAATTVTSCVCSSTTVSMPGTRTDDPARMMSARPSMSMVTSERIGASARRTLISGMFGDEGREPAGQPVRAHDASGGDGELTALEGEVAGAQLLDLADVLEHADGELAQGPADIGELHVATHPLQQRQPEGCLEAAHHAADRSLGEAECLGRGGHVLAFGHGKKRVQLIERDPGPRMPRARLRRAHRGVSREAPVLGGGRLRRWPRARRQPTRRRSGCRCRRSRPGPRAPRTDRRRR